MKTEADQILDDLLDRWHRWSTGFSLCPQPGADPMFRNAKSSRGYDTVDDIVEGELAADTMEAIDFEVGEMHEPQRSAIYAAARNLAAKNAVWLSPRLPKDPVARALLVLEARATLTRRLLRCGVM